MAYWVDDTWDNAPQVTQADTAAFGLYCRCGVWVARNLTDGFVPSKIAAGYGSREWAARLVDAGLWVSVDGGFHMPDYLALNPSREKALARREAAKARQAKHRGRTTRESHVTDAVTGGVTERAPSHPATPDGVGGRTRTRAPRAHDHPHLRAVPDKCPTHELELPCRGCAADAKAGAG